MRKTCIWQHLCGGRHTNVKAMKILSSMLKNTFVQFLRPVLLAVLAVGGSNQLIMMF